MKESSERTDLHMVRLEVSTAPSAVDGEPESFRLTGNVLLLAEQQDVYLVLIYLQQSLYNSGKVSQTNGVT